MYRFVPSQAKGVTQGRVKAHFSLIVPFSKQEGRESTALLTTGISSHLYPRHPQWHQWHAEMQLPNIATSGGSHNPTICRSLGGEMQQLKLRDLAALDVEAKSNGFINNLFVYTYIYIYYRDRQRERESERDIQNML